MDVRVFTIAASCLFVGCTSPVSTASAYTEWKAAAVPRLQERLAAAASVVELEKAVADLGLVLNTADGGWLAFAYEDDHSDPAQNSLTVVRTSAGVWLISHEHFCGALAVYRAERERRDVSAPSPAARFTRLDEVERAPTVWDAIAVLKQSGRYTDLTPVLHQANQSLEPTSFTGSDS